MRITLLALVLLLSPAIQASMIIETIDLRYRDTEEIIPIIRPMLIDEASVTGTGYKLIIKSTPQNIDQIKSLLAELDVDQTQLIIHVAINNKQDMSDSEASIRVQGTRNGNTVSIGTPPPQSNNSPATTDNRIKYDASVIDNSQHRQQPVAQVVRVSEGYWATIQMGQAVPIANRILNRDGTVTETITWRNVTSGFRVMPRTNGDQVTLTIMPHSDSIDPANPGSINTSAMQTTMSAKLGEWIHIGGTREQATENTSGISYRTRVRDTKHNQIWLKVERP